jgi:signal transduction histidine kinase
MQTLNWLRHRLGKEFILLDWLVSHRSSQFMLILSTRAQLPREVRTTVPTVKIYQASFKEPKRAGMMDDSEPTLKGLFNDAKRDQDELNSLDPRSATFKDTLQSIIDDLQRCRQLIRQLSLFSKNEEIEDVATQDLQ